MWAGVLDWIKWKKCIIFDLSVSRLQMQCDQLSHTPATMTLPPRWAAPLNWEPKQILSSLNACVRYFVTPKRKLISDNSTLCLQPTISLSKHRACQSPQLERVSQNKSLSYGTISGKSLLSSLISQYLGITVPPPISKPWICCLSFFSRMGSEPLIWAPSRPT